MQEKEYKRKSPRAIAKKVYDRDFWSDTVTMILANDDETVVEVDATAVARNFAPYTVVVVDVLPHPWAQEVAELIWDNLDWDEVDDDDCDPRTVDVSTKGWSVRMKTWWN